MQDFHHPGAKKSSDLIPAQEETLTRPCKRMFTIYFP